MFPNFIEKTKIPHKPGIYMFKNESGKVIYVGKAIDLYSRVSSYFNGKPDRLKTAQLVEKIRELDTIIVTSELEALILEANLIKKYWPVFNISLKDDKDYLYIGITKEDFPKVITTRKQDLKQFKKYFGPFPSSRTVKLTLKKLRRVFPWCSNPPKLESRIKNQESRPCFYYHLGLCPGACADKISKEDYNKIINRFAKFLDGKKEELIKELESEMHHHSSNLKYEEAEKIKKTIIGINYLTQSNRVEAFLENPNFLQDETNLGLRELQKALNLSTLPRRIEGYDISNIQGKDATGSMVVLTDGDIDKSQYRKFKIRISGKPNDVGMHKEMMRRRLGHPEWGIPDLILIDGGRGQVRGVKDQIVLSIMYYVSRKTKKSLTIQQFNSIPIFGLAKREEWLYSPNTEIIKLPKKSTALKLVQKLRDESHRFAITYHRKLRSKTFFGV